MNYRIVIVILTSLLIGASIGWFAGVKYTTTGIENVSSTPSISQIQPVSTKITEETAEKSIDIPLNKLGDCADAIVTLHPLVVQYAQNATCNCDEAQTTLEMNFCSSTKACIERKKFAILSQKVLAQYDPEIVEQNQFIAIAKKITIHQCWNMYLILKQQKHYRKNLCACILTMQNWNRKSLELESVKEENVLFMKTVKLQNFWKRKIKNWNNF
jgi:hypothetical protein